MPQRTRRIPVSAPSATRTAEGRGLGLPNEAELIARLRRRDLDALGTLYEHLGDDMTTLARSLLRDSDEAADVVEDVLMRVHDAAPNFRGERGLRTWVLRITANRCRDLLRRRRFHGGRPEEIDPLASARLHANPVSDWDEQIDRPRFQAALERAIAALPEDQQRAVILRHRLGLSYEEAAEVLGIPLGALKSRLFRAREALRQAVKEQFRDA